MWARDIEDVGNVEDLEDLEDVEDASEEIFTLDSGFCDSRPSALLCEYDGGNRENTSEGKKVQRPHPISRCPPHFYRQHLSSNPHVFMQHLHTNQSVRSTSDYLVSKWRSMTNDEVDAGFDPETGIAMIPKLTGINEIIWYS
jgi:hypothetical protein